MGRNQQRNPEQQALGVRDCELPCGRVTGVGSLPHLDAEAAVRFVACHSPEIPFWPQLPQRGAQEDGIVQTLAPLMPMLWRSSPAHLDLLPWRLASFLELLREGPVGLDAGNAGGFFALERAVQQGLFPHARVFKGHLYGPLTLARCLYLNGRPLLEESGVAPRALYDALAEYVRRMALWQIQRMQAWGKPVLLVLDEPALALVESDSKEVRILRDLLGALRDSGAMVGIHCCALPTPRAIFAAQPDLVSFDSHYGMHDLLAYAETAAFVRRGGWLAWGMVPTTADLGTIAVDALFAEWMMELARTGLDLDQVAAQSLVTATCGLGLLTEASAEQNFAFATALAADLRTARGTANRRTA